MRFQGYPLESASKSLNELKNLNITDFDNYLNETKWRQYKHHLNNNKFYKNFIGDLEIEK